MTYVYHIVTIRVNEIFRAHVWRLRFRYLGTGYDRLHDQNGGAEKSKIATKIRSRVDVLKRDRVKIVLVHGVSDKDSRPPLSPNRVLIPS
jgi:hypothetical protein